MTDRTRSENVKNSKKTFVADFSGVKKQETSAQKKLNMSKTLLKEIENDFDDFELFLNTDKVSKVDHKIDDKILNSMNLMDKVDLKFKKNRQDYEEILDDYENLEFFVEDKEEEERNDQVRSLQQYNSIVHDIFGYNVYFNKLFIKLDKEKLEFMLNEHKIVNLIDRKLESFLYAKDGNKRKHWIYDAYTESDLLMSFEERKAVFEKFDLWLKNLHEFYYGDKKSGNKDKEPSNKRQRKNLRKSSSESKNKTYPIHNEINLNVLLLLQVLFMLSNDFFHNNMKYQCAFNSIFDLNNYLAYIKNNIPVVHDRLSTITLKELNTFKFFKVFLDKNYVNDYHIGIFMKLKLLPQNIVNIFRETYYGNDFEKFVKSTVILNTKDIEKNERKIIDLQDPEIDKMKEDAMLKNSLINLKSCIKMEETHLLSIKRAIKIQNYFVNRERTDELFKQLTFLQTVVTGRDVKYYKHLAVGILKDLHELKLQQQSAKAEHDDAAKLIGRNKEIKTKSLDRLKNSDYDTEIDDAQATANNYGFSKDSLPDLYIKRLIETKLISCDSPKSNLM